MTEPVEDKKQLILDAYFKHISDKQTIPTRTDLLDLDVANDVIRRQFGSLTRLHQYIEDNHADQLSQHITSQGHVFSERNLKNLDESLGTFKRFIVTSAVSGKKVEEGFLNTINAYCKIKQAKLLIIPCADIASRYKEAKWAFDPLIRDEVFITEEAKLNSNIFISNIHLSAKQIQPTTGLGRIAQRNGSCIFASPKQFLKYSSTSPDKNRMPRAMMTTGAITVGDYSNDKYMSQRISYIAESDHVVGAVIVEVVDDIYFHFRQIQANRAGEFVDLGIRYFPDGSTKKEVTHFYAGDWHSSETDGFVAETALGMCNDLDVEDFYVGDFFTGRSITHHDEGRPLKKAIKAHGGVNNLVEELLGCVADLTWILDNIGGDINLIKGNHDEVLERYLIEGRFSKDYENMYDALDMAKDLMDGKNPLAEALQRVSDNPEIWERIHFINRDEEARIGHVECGQHGDLGPNGSNATLANLEEAYGDCIVGHTHSAAIFRGVWRVGTFTHLQLEYNTGPSSWTHTGCLVYPDGSRQLINFINGQYRLWTWDDPDNQ